MRQGGVWKRKEDRDSKEVDIRVETGRRIQERKREGKNKRRGIGIRKGRLHNGRGSDNLTTLLISHLALHLTCS